MLGVELVRPGKEPAPEETDRILDGLKDRGVLAGKTGPFRNVLTFLPPLVLEESDIDTVLGALGECLYTETSAPGPRT